MIQFKKAALVIALTAGMIGGAQAAVQSVTSLTVTGGDFGMGQSGSLPGGVLVTAGGASPIVMGTYQGSVSGTTHAADVTSLTSMDFFFSPVFTFTAASVAGIAGGGPAPTGTVDNTAGTINLNLSSFFASWNGTSFNQGGSATGTYVAATGAYDMNWTSLISGGSFDGKTGYWHLKGVASAAAAPAPAPVPLPAAVWLLGSGLIGMVGVARRRKSGNTANSNMTAA